MNFNSHQQDFRRRPMVFDSLDCKLGSVLSSSSGFHHQHHLSSAMMPFHDVVAGLEADITATDVLCGRGKTSFNHVGNRRFRDLIAASTDKYNNAKSRLEKSMVVHSLVEQVRKVKGRFLKQDRFSGRWYELDERQTKEKVGHAIRDATSSLDPKKKMIKKIKSANSNSSSSSKGSSSPGSTTSAAKKVVIIDDEDRLPEAPKLVPPRSDSVSSTATNGSAVTVTTKNTSSKSSVASNENDNDNDPWDDLEPLHVDSLEAKNCLAALRKNDLFLRQMNAVLGPCMSSPKREATRQQQQEEETLYAPLPLEIM